MAVTMGSKGPKSWDDGKTMAKPWENGDVHGKSPCSMVKSTISTGPFSSSQTVNVYQRVTRMITMVASPQMWSCTHK